MKIYKTWNEYIEGEFPNYDGWSEEKEKD